MAQATEQPLIAALDIGSSKVSALIATTDGDDRLRVLGTGQRESRGVIALPEGQQAAKVALSKFAELDKATGLLGRGLLRFDLRLPGKMIVRLPRAPGEALAAPATGG